MNQKNNNNTKSDDFDVDFSKKREQRVSEPVSKPDELHIPVKRRVPPKRPNRKNMKYKPPKETVLIYTIMAAAILMIVTVVFVISLNSIKNTESGTGDDDSSSLSAYLISGNPSSNSADDSSDSSNSGDSVSKPDSIVVPADYGYDYFKNDLFIGDSIFTGLYSYDGILNADNVAAEKGFTPYRAHYNTLDSDKGTAVDYAKSIKPKHINIMLGTNAFALGIPYTELIDDYKDLINALKAACPNSKICVISIPPITKDSSAAESAEITKDKINTVNKYIEKMCTEMNIKYFDLNTLLSDNDGYFKDEYAESDGMHFMRDTYDVLLYGLERMWNDSSEAQSGGETNE